MAVHPRQLVDLASLSYLQVVALNPRRGAVWGGATLSDTETAQRLLALACVYLPQPHDPPCDNRAAVEELVELLDNHDVLLGVLDRILASTTRSYNALPTAKGRLAGPPPPTAAQSTGTVPPSLDIVPLPSKWSTWASFGPKGLMLGRGERATPSQVSYARVSAVRKGRSADEAASAVDDAAKPVVNGYGGTNHVLMRMFQRGTRRRSKEKKVHHSQVEFMCATTTDQQRCLADILHAGFDPRVHGNINDAVQGRQEFSPEVVVEHLPPGESTGYFTTATTHNLCLKVESEVAEALRRQELGFVRLAALRKKRGVSMASSRLALVNEDSDTMETFDAQGSGQLPLTILTAESKFNVGTKIVLRNMCRREYEGAEGTIKKIVCSDDQKTTSHVIELSSGENFTLQCPEGKQSKSQSPSRPTSPPAGWARAPSAERPSRKEERGRDGVERSNSKLKNTILTGRMSQTFCTALCGETQAVCSQRLDSLEHDATQSCGLCVTKTSRSIIYFGLMTAKKYSKYRGMQPVEDWLDGTLYDKDPGWMAVCLADGAFWSGPQSKGKQLISEKSWMHAFSDHRRATTADGAPVGVVATEPQPEPEPGHESALETKTVSSEGKSSDGLPRFAAEGDMIVLSIDLKEPECPRIKVQKNGNCIGSHPIPPDTAELLQRDMLSWAVTTLDVGDIITLLPNPTDRMTPAEKRAQEMVELEQEEKIVRRQRAKPVDAGISYRCDSSCKYQSNALLLLKTRAHDVHNFVHVRHSVQISLLNLMLNSI